MCVEYEQRYNHFICRVFPQYIIILIIYTRTFLKVFVTLACYFIIDDFGAFTSSQSSKKNGVCVRACVCEHDLYLLL